MPHPASRHRPRTHRFIVSSNIVIAHHTASAGSSQAPATLAQGRGFALGEGLKALSALHTHCFVDAERIEAGPCAITLCGPAQGTNTIASSQSAGLGLPSWRRKGRCTEVPGLFWETFFYKTICEIKDGIYIRAYRYIDLKTYLSPVIFVRLGIYYNIISCAIRRPSFTSHIKRFTPRPQ
jgi:hypothetical protein